MKLKKATGIIVPFIVILLSALSCNTAVKVAGGITDDLDRTINFDTIPQKVISLAPSNTEILFALGLDDSVVGISDFCDYPDQVNTRSALEDGAVGKIARVGNAFAVNIEAIVALNPDLVIGFGYNMPYYVEPLESQGLTVLILGPESIDDIMANIELVGTIMGIYKTAVELTSQLRDDLATITAKTALVSRPGVFCETGFGGGIWTTGSGSFVSNLVMLAGGTDIGVAVSKSNPNISMEYIVAANPDMIILADAPWVTPADVKARGGAWDSLTAVQNNKIYEVVDANVVSRNGPRVVEGVMALLEIIHPDIYAELQEQTE
jgi:iron complex transport system substrate-binding protein